jgi:hypothetical protein
MTFVATDSSARSGTAAGLRGSETARAGASDLVTILSCRGYAELRAITRHVAQQPTRSCHVVMCMEVRKMTKSEKEKLIRTNAVIWAVGIIASFVLPMVTESLTDGRGAFLKMMVHVFPLIIAMVASTGVISKAVGRPTT